MNPNSREYVPPWMARAEAPAFAPREDPAAQGSAPPDAVSGAAPAGGDRDSSAEAAPAVAPPVEKLKPVSLSSKPVSISSKPPTPVSISSKPPTPVSISSKPVSISSKPAAAPATAPTAILKREDPAAVAAAAAAATAAAAAPAPAPAKAAVAAAKPPPPPSAAGGDDDEEEVDENDPLWKAVLVIANGDRKAALKMLEDPDALMAYPEVKAIMEAGGDDDAGGEEDWDKAVGVEQLKGGPVSAETVSKPSATAGGASATASSGGGAAAASSSTSAAAAAVGDDEDAGLEDAGGISEADPREHLNIVFIGHVDAGKSTLSGSILYIMGMVDHRTIERYEREAKTRNRESWFLAFIMDTSEEERAKGKTVEVGRAHFETAKNRYTILDAPGHKNYVPNMIAGAAQADVGVLVISARKGEFETGFEKGGQTREHALLCKTLGVQFLVVVINKMDDPTVQWDVERYEYCVGKLKPYLKTCGYVIKTEVKFLPISGLTGDNILKEVAADRCPWWADKCKAGEHNTSTPTVLSTLDALTLSGRNPDGPLRIPCLDRYIERGCVVLGKVESGTLRMDEEIVIAPTKKKARVEAIFVGETKVRSAKPGENVLIKMAVNAEDIQKGFVLCRADQLCPQGTIIKVQLALVDLLDHRPIFCPGYDAVLHVHTIEIECQCVELISVMDKGKQMKRPFARQGQMCLARLSMPLSTCMEAFTALPSMGRLTLRDEGKTIAIGKVIEVCV